MLRPNFLSESLQRLQTLTNATYNPQIAPLANQLWEKHLQAKNPLWKFVTAKPFFFETKNGSAHVIAMIDKRLPNLGLVGYFACSDAPAGAKALKEAEQWFKKRGISEIFGPINGTATSDYRLNLSDDYWFPGEPVNPLFHIDAFQKAGFAEFNHYGSGLVKHHRLFAKAFIRLPKDHTGITIRPFNVQNQLRDLKTFHELMTAIFPHQSIYCPTLSWEERLYNFSDKNLFFNPRYTYFLEDKDKPVGMIISFPFKQNLVIKTIGVLPEYREKHLSSLLIRRVHEVAAEDNLKAAIYAMVRFGNTIHKRKRPGVKTVRHYVTMRKRI